MDMQNNKNADNRIYQLLREGKVGEANALIASGEAFDFTATNFRGMNLQGLNVVGIDFSDSYFRAADLRGLDLRTCNLEGASLHNAHVSGVYFPDTLPPQEITLSVIEGTRLRYS